MKITHAFLIAAAALLAFGSAELAAQEQAEGARRHPSYNLIGRDAQSAESPLNPNFVVEDEARLSESGFWRSSYIQDRIVGLVVKDIDQDGKNEIIYATVKGVFVARNEGGRLNQLAAYPLNIGERLASLDVYNADKTGPEEIFAAYQSNSVSGGSIILHYTGGQLVRAVEGVVPWYLRVTNGPGGPVLAGQQPARSGDVVFAGNVMEMSFDGKKIKSQGRLAAPDGANAFNFTFGRLGSSNASMSALIKWPSEHLFLLEGRDSRLWESREEYAGTMTVLEPPNGDNGSGNGASPVRYFIPTRLLIADIDRDGQNELIVAKNDHEGVPFMSNLRTFPSGTVQAFKYTNMSLSPFFRTRTLPGPAVDYALADHDNNGSLDLVVAVMMEQESGMLEQGRSVIVAYELSPGTATKKNTK